MSFVPFLEVWNKTDRNRQSLKVSSRDTLGLEAGGRIRTGLILEVRGCCSVSSGMSQTLAGRREWWEGCWAFVPTSLRGPQPGPFPLLAAEMNQERQHTDLRRLEALQKYEVSPGE